MNRIYEILESADGLIVSSPVYFGTLSGQLKMLFDRTLLLRRNGFLLKDKIGAALAVGASRNGGQEYTIWSIHAWMHIHGMIVVGDAFRDFEKPTFAMNNRWKYFEGYYQYKPVNGDSAFFAAFLFKSGIPIGGVQFTVDQTTTSYTYFSKEIAYYTSVAPDSAVVFISSSNPDDSRGEGSWLLLDDIQFSDNNSSVFDVNLNKLTVYPNPFQNEIHFSGIDQMIGADFTIVDVLGKPVTEGILTRNLTVDLTDQLPGVYILHISGKHVKTTKILVKE